MDNWDEIKTAYQVARMGTVSGAASVLGVHHATVIRHIDSLEKRLGEKLFQRHARGYTATEAGRDLLAVAQVTEEQFAQLSSRIKGHGETVSGELVVTAVADISGALTKSLVDFQIEHPGLIIRLLTGQRLFRLDYGEAHVALRAGAAPSEPDYVVQPFRRLRFGLYAAPSYIARHGMPKTDVELADHYFVGTDTEDSRAPFYTWLRDHNLSERVIYRATEPATIAQAMVAGAGLSFETELEMRHFPEMIQVMPPRPEWEIQLWLVTHVDLHRTLKVQKFLAHLKANSAHWKDI
jgi:DNA-binding transcriptional LysR family regulator